MKIGGIYFIKLFKYYGLLFFIGKPGERNIKKKYKKN